LKCHPHSFLEHDVHAPTQDRDEPGMGFTHKPGDIVTIAAPKLGALVNRMKTSSECEPWTFGLRAFMANLAQRGLLTSNPER
jgi:fumarylacetoacetate (FAA) hydrolase family protein